MNERRPRGHPARARLTASILTGVVLVAALLGARNRDDPWFEHYHRGTVAINRSNWEKAIQELNAAVEGREESGRNARTYGVRFVRYFPYYFLGVAHFSLGRDAEALAFLKEELDQKEIQKNDKFSSNLMVLMDAIEGARSAGEGAAENPHRLSELDSLVASGTRLRAEGRFLEAMAALERVLALDSTDSGAKGALEELRNEALQEELANYQFLSRGSGEDPTGAEGSPSPAAEAAILEAKAQEIFHHGVALMTEGDLEGALTRFELTLAFLEDEEWTSRELYSDAQKHKELIATQVRRSRESEYRALWAAERNLEETPPIIMLFSPANVDEPLTTEVVRVQGVATDAHGVAEVLVFVNGEEWGAADIGQRRRGIKVAARPTTVDGVGYGQAVEFSRDLVLTQAKNQVAVRVRNTKGLESEIDLEIEVDAEESRIFAAIVGVGDYADPAITDLQYAVADAESVRSYLIEEMGLPSDQVMTLLNEEATFQAIRRLLRTDLRSKAKENDQVIIYFAGHGAPDQFGDAGDGDGVEKYLMTYDTESEDVSGTGFPMQDVAEALSRLEASRVVYIVDACFSGAVGGGSRTWGHGTGVTITDGFLGRLTGNTPGRVILSASAANEPSLESQALGHGVFTYFLLEGLRGAADADNNTVVTVPELYSFVARQVPESTGRRQHPTMSGELGGDMVLGRTLRN